MLLYHGTNNPDTIGIRKPKSGNTPAFYLTPCKLLASQYGSDVLVFDVPVDTELTFVIRPIEHTTEWLVTTQRDFNNLLRSEM